MTTKKLVTLTIVAVALAGVAYWSNSGRKMKAPSLVGKKVLAPFDMSKVAKLEIGGPKKLALASTDEGWVISSMYGYPADMTKIRENLLKLQDLKVGQVAADKKIDKPALVDLQDAFGKSIAALSLGDTHMRKPTGPQAQYGGGSYPDGRYVLVDDKVALVKDPLDAFDGDPKKWTDTKISAVPSADATAIVMKSPKETVKMFKKDSSWTIEGLSAKEEFDTSKSYGVDSALSYLNFTDVVDPKKTEAELGFTTGAVYTVTLKNGQTYTAKIGNTAANGSDRYFKVSATFKAAGTNAAENAKFSKAVDEFNAKAGKWTYTIASYSAQNMTKARKDLVKAKEEPKKDEAKPAPKAETKPAPKAPAKPAVKKTAGPVSQAVSKPVAKKAAAKPPVKSAVVSVADAAAKPAPKKATAKPAPKAEKKPAAKPARK